MYCFQYILCLVSVFQISHEVKVNLQGSLRVDKDFKETLEHYMTGKNNLSSLSNLSYRRTLPETQSNDQNIEPAIIKIVETAFLCRDLEFCEYKYGELEDLVNNYIIALITNIEGIFNLEDKAVKENNQKRINFGEVLKSLLADVRTLLVNADNAIDDPDYVWLDLIKKISKKLNNRAFTFLLQRLEGSPDEVKKVKKILRQELTVAIARVELEFEHKLCVDQRICTKHYDCTRALNTLLERIQILPEETTRKFVRYFHETLPDTGFYYTIGNVTTNEFQSVLKDMTYSESVPSQKVFSAMLKSVKGRLDFVKQNIESADGIDVKLVNAILSDMDHIYAKHREPFSDFLSAFFKWSNKGGIFRGPLRRLMNSIQKTVIESGELSQKLQNEVKVFLELTVDPDK